MLEFLVFAGIGAVGWGAYKIGALRKIYSGILGRIDNLAEKVKDPIADLQLRHLEILKEAKESAELYERLGGEKKRLEKQKEHLETEIAKLKKEYGERLEEIKKEYGEEVPIEVAQEFQYRKRLIETKEKLLETIQKKLERIETNHKKLGAKVKQLNEQAKILYEYIEHLKLEKTHAKIQSKEIEEILKSPQDDKFKDTLREIEEIMAENEGQSEAREEMVKMFASSKEKTVSVDSLSL